MRDWKFFVGTFRLEKVDAQEGIKQENRSRVHAGNTVLGIATSFSNMQIYMYEGVE